VNISPHVSDELLSAYVDGVVAGEEAVAAGTHIFSCADCSRRLELLRATRAAVQSLPVEALPRPIDLAFLGGDGAATNAERRGFFAWLGRRPPAWLAPVASAATVLALLVALAPGIHVTPGASTVGTGQRQISAGLGSGGVEPRGALASSAPGATSNQKNFEQGVAPLAAAPVPRPYQVSSQFPAAGGTTLSLAASPASARVSQSVQLTVTATGGDSDKNLSSRGLQLYARHGTAETALGGVSGSGETSTLRSHEQLTFNISWTAGGNSGSGSYTLIARLFLADGSVLEVQLAYTVG
jgi:anti-sigma factor RsiW